MDIETVMSILREGLQSPVETWPGFSPERIPLVIFSEAETAYLNHPSPPPIRPPDLMAATAQEVGGVLTATLPLWMVQDEKSLLPLVYHECFHVYQESGGFSPFDLPEDFAFHEALAVYPELDPYHRAICRAEVEVLNQMSLSLLEKARLLSRLSFERNAILNQNPNARTLLFQMERHEGTAFYIQQEVDLALNGTPIPCVKLDFGYSRQYHTGAACCRLLNQIHPGWCQEIKNGLSPSQLLIQLFPSPDQDLEKLELEVKASEEAANIRVIQTKLAPLFQGPVVRFLVPRRGPQRGFNPMTVLSLGDGRLVHTDLYFYRSQAGTLQLKRGQLVEDFNRDELLLPAFDARLNGTRLDVDSDAISIHLEGIKQIEEGVFTLRED